MRFSAYPQLLFMNDSSAPKSILLLAANPEGTNALRLQEEEREIKERLRLAGYGKLPINSVGATRPKDIQQAMLDFKPQVVHFSGHGVGEDGLVFEDATGQEKLVDSEALAQIFKLFPSVECVVLNACFSKFQAEAIAQYVDYVIGMSQSISDRAAIEFAIGFYSALGAGESIDFSYELGCNAILLEGIPGNLIPILIRKADLLLIQKAKILSSSMETLRPEKNIQYLNPDNNQEEAHINRTISYIQRWNELSFSRVKVLSFMRDIVKLKYDERSDFISHKTDEDIELRAELIGTLNFLEEMAILIGNQLVHESLLYQFFRGIVITYVEVFSIWIQVRRASTANGKIYERLTDLYERWERVK